MGTTEEPTAALVTGASRGIGRAIATRLASEGFRVAGTFLTTDPPAGVASDWFHLDLSDPDSLRASDIPFGDFPVFVANAGAMSSGPLRKTPLSEYRRLLEINFLASVEIVKQVLPGMIRRRYGRIILVSSAGAFVGDSGLAAYAASKSALLGYCRSLTRELGSRNITCNIVAPGYVDTDILANVSDEVLHRRIQAIPAGRLGYAGEVAATVAFLASADAGYISGAIIPVDGGLSMGI